MGKGNATTTQQIQIPPEVLARYNAVNQRAEDAASKPFQIYSNNPNDFVAPVNETQQAGIGGINAAQGMYSPYGQQALGTLNAYQQRTDPLYAQAEGLIPAAYQQGQGYLNSATALAGGAYSGAQGYNQGATGYALAGGQSVGPTQINGAAINQFMNPYLSTVLAGTLAPLQQQQKIDQSNLTGNAIAQGAFGGDRSGIAKAVLAGQQDMAVGNVASNILNTGYNNALGAAQQQQGVYLGAGQANRSATQSTADRLASIGQQGFQQGNTTANTMAGLGAQGYSQGIGAAQAASGLAGQIFNQGNTAANTVAGLGTTAQQNELAARNAQIQAGGVQQTTDQAGKTALFNQFQQQQAYPFQTSQFLANVAEGTGALSGNTTTTNQPAPFFSDERLKDDMEVIGKTFDGQKIIKFRYKGSPQKHIGLVAQDVEKHHPEAVGLARGFKTVDYDEATKEAADKGHYARGGLVPMAYKRYADGGVAMMYPYGSDTPGRTGGGPYGTGFAPSSTRELMRPGSIPKLPASGLHALASTANDIDKLVDMGTGAYNLYKDYKGSHGDFENSDDPDMQMARGGLVPRGKFAIGGLPYTQSSNDGYVPANDDNKTAGTQASASPIAQQQSGLGKLAQTAGAINSIASLGTKIAGFFNRGGLAGGRHGYATDGSVDDDQGSRERELMDEIAAEPAAGLGPDTYVPTRRDPAPLSMPEPANDVRGLGAAEKSRDIEIPVPSPNQSEIKVKPYISQTRGDKPDWFQRNQNWLIPVLKGVGTAASSPSRYALGAILQGVGGGAQAYQDLQKQEQEYGVPSMTPGYKGVSVGSDAAKMGQNALGYQLKQREIDINARQQAIELLRYYTQNMERYTDPASGQTFIRDKITQRRMSPKEYQSKLDTLTGQIEGMTREGTSGAPVNQVGTITGASPNAQPRAEKPVAMSQKESTAQTPSGTVAPWKDPSVLSKLKPTQRTADPNAIDDSVLVEAQRPSLLLNKANTLRNQALNNPDTHNAEQLLAQANEFQRQAAEITSGHVVPVSRDGSQFYGYKTAADMIGANQHDAADTLSTLNKRAEAAVNSQRMLSEMRHEIDQIPESGLLVAGSGNPERQKFVKTVNTVVSALGGQPIFDDKALTASQLLDKDTFRLGQNLGNSMGHAPGFIVDQALGAVPSLLNTKTGYKRLLSSLEQAAQYDRDRREFLTKFRNDPDNNNSLITKGGVHADDIFNSLNPPEKYVLKAMADSVPQEHVDFLMQNGPKALKAFDRQYGSGVGEFILKQQQ